MNFNNMDNILLCGLGIVAILLIIFIVISILNCVKLKKICQNSKNGDLADAIEKYYNKIETMHTDIKNMSRQFEVYEKQLLKCYKHSAVVHYNAFGDISGNLSFSMAVLDDNLDGFIMTSLYGHDSSSIYLRDVSRGKCNVTISEEEKYVLEHATE